MTPAVSTRPAIAADAHAISALHALVFGPGRFARAAYRVREGTGDVSRFCRVATVGRELIAALRFTEVAIGGQTGALLLGPLAVAPGFAGQGHGRRLIAEGIDAARASGIRIIVLVGDEPYYGRFGFRRVPPGAITLPGPADPARILALPIEDGALDNFKGPVTAARG